MRVCVRNGSTRGELDIHFKKSLYVQHINMSNVICVAWHIWEVKLMIAFLEKWNIDKVDEPARSPKPTHKQCLHCSIISNLRIHFYCYNLYLEREKKKVFAGVKYNIENVSNITLNTPNDDSVILHSDFYDGTYIFFPLYSSILCVIQSIWFLMSIFVISFIFGVWIFRIGFHFDTWINILCVSVSRPWCACICVEI